MGILDERIDDFNHKVFSPQIEGTKTSLALAGIVDQVITLAEIKNEDGSLYRAFVNHTLNPYGYPAKDRSGRLNMLEAPHLEKLMEKIKQPIKSANERLELSIPTTPTINPKGE